MTKVIGVRFRNAGKVYYFDPKDLELKNGDSVIVETARGMECGRAVFSPREVDDSRVQQPLRPVLRRATEAWASFHSVHDTKNGGSHRSPSAETENHGRSPSL